MKVTGDEEEKALEIAVELVKARLNGITDPVFEELGDDTVAYFKTVYRGVLNVVKESFYGHEID